MKLVLATTNKGKLKEITALLSGLGVEVKGLSDFPGCPEVVEDGKTFRENALKKAREVAAFTGLPALADDSGLEVDALDGAPGVYSARFSGKDADDGKNNRKLLKLLKDTPQAGRGCRFVCVLAFAGPPGSGIREKVLRGEVKGRVAHEPRGPHGFGYDPLFYYHPARKTFAEMGPEAKNRVSHRGRALKKFREYLKGQTL
ncbi:MAG: XTP/dITP diphosphatase [Nitrospirae bacterium]|nr:XTP/dITP diphosphatase [Nitrospirota bacterium]